MIEALLAALGEAGADVGPEELADILWLARQVGPPAGPAAPDPGEAGAAPGAPPPPLLSLPAPVVAEPPERLFPAEPAAAEGDGPEPLRGVPVRVPRASSLADPLAVMRSLRPVGRRARGGAELELDEELTVVRSVEQLLPTPVLRPVPSRWLDLALVVDSHPSMLLWHDLVAELHRVIVQTGVFRDVRLWFLSGTGAGEVPSVAHRPGAAPHRPQEIAAPSGHRLVLVVTDTVGAGWGGGALHGVLRQWAQHNPVAVLNVLPERLWTRGAARPAPQLLRSAGPAAPNTAWQRVPAAGRPRTRRRAGPRAGPAVPVVDTSPAGLGRLARLVAGSSPWQRMTCLLVGPAPEQRTTPVPVPEPPSSTRQALERFREGSSPTAQRLAGFLAAVPLTLPVMTLVRRAMLPESEHGHLAEVALSGLLEPWSGDGSGLDPDRVEFAFRPGVREALLGSQRRHRIADVQALVPQSVWRYLDRLPRDGSEFSATRVGAPDVGSRTVSAGRLPFAERPDAGAAAATGPAREPRAPRGGPVGWRFADDGGPVAAGLPLTPWTFLTCGHPSPADAERRAVVWDGGRWVRCRPVWTRHDDGSDAVLMRAETALTDPVEWARPAARLPWGEITAGTSLTGCRVWCPTEAGDPVTLGGVLLRREDRLYFDVSGASAPVIVTSQFQGAPVLHQDVLLGCVTGAEPGRPDRLRVRPIGPLLRDEEFLAQLRRDRGPAPSAERVAVPAASTWCMAVEVKTGSRAPGSPVPSAAARASRAAFAMEQRIRGMLVGILRDRSVDGVVTTPVAPDDGADLLVVPAGSPDPAADALGIVAELADRLAALNSDPRGEHRVVLGVALATGPAADLALGPAAGEAVARGMVRLDPVLRRMRNALRAPGGFPELVLAVSGSVRAVLLSRSEELRAEAFRPVGGTGPHHGDSAYVFDDDPRLLRHAAATLSGDPVRVPDGPPWPHCGLDASDRDPVGCRGVRVPGHPRCLAHLTPDQRAAHLSGLGPGDAVDVSGTELTAGVLAELLHALRDPAGGWARFGAADFTEAVFEGAGFSGAHFSGSVTMDGATFHGATRFDRASFLGPARLRGATFHGGVSFHAALFMDRAAFDHMTVHGPTDFGRAVFQHHFTVTHATCHGPADFRRAVFRGTMDAAHSTIHNDLDCSEAVFEGPASFDRITVHGDASYAGARFDAAATFTGCTVNGTLIVDGAGSGGSSPPLPGDRAVERPAAEPAGPTIITVEGGPGAAADQAHDLQRWLEEEPALRGRLRRAAGPSRATGVELAAEAIALLASSLSPPGVSVLAQALVSWLQTRRNRDPAITITGPDGTEVRMTAAQAGALDARQSAELARLIASRLGTGTATAGDAPPEPEGAG
ncbi:SAV_2336 N-terminal domain-related protein [Streptomyces sp. NPDC018031]|uniref:effector-associated constant component EACC1 n=1 Tax=Streptomyces sp. NPDC018031 TaxID=3365033 RepID=UPI00378E7D0E